MAKSAHEHTGSAETLRPSLRNGFTAYFVLFPENGSFRDILSQLRVENALARKADQFAGIVGWAKRSVPTIEQRAR
ncbi:hypothetical protein CQ12_06560 [Bradyrhizobium jicamae]|uniref:Uncharacterized protein n=1 Tax=Bradyrhizobium jicamae TaxID=280332 RepID=A0A0R3L4A5_9BRAD|nr:hypothetical protein CQ12_06560 [Bradyrhizobium jicamae]